MAFTERSRAAREAILDAARRRFTEQGYDRTTIRAVALDAGVDPSMVMRYYGSKEGLFTSAVDVDLRLPDPGSVPLEQLGEVLARHFRLMWGEPGQESPLAVLLRSAVTHEDAAERLRGVFARQIAAMVRAATGDAPDADVRAGLLASHLLGIALTRYVLRIPPVVELDDERLVPFIAQSLRRILLDPLPGG